jgi:hypothetical protein
MATYLELKTLSNDSDLNDRIQVAAVVAAETVRSDGTPPANQAARLAWSAKVMQNPIVEAKRMIWAILAQNKDSSAAAIQASTDATLQTAVDNVVDLFADNA